MAGYSRCDVPGVVSNAVGAQSGRSRGSGLVAHRSRLICRERSGWCGRLQVTTNSWCIPLA
jgi:hypothetical protein